MAEESGLIPFAVKDFSGGKTDYYIGGASNKAREMDNFIINENGKLVSRPGSELAYNIRIDATNPIRSIIDHNTIKLPQAGKKIYSIEEGDPDVATSIKSPQTHEVFTRGDGSSKIAHDFWNKHTLVTTDAFNTPRKVYQDDGGNWVNTTLGLPRLEYALASNLANDLKTKFNAHLADLTVHTVADAVNVVTGTASDLQSLIDLTTELMTKYAAHHADSRLGAAWLYHHAQGADFALASAVAPVSLTEVIERLTDLKAKYNSHDGDDTAHDQDDLHPTTLSPILTVTKTAGASSYIYALHYSYRYNVEDTEFLERGGVIYFEVDSASPPNVDNITLGNIPALVSGTLENWDDADITIKIHRTIDADATAFYFLAEIDNGTTSYVDSTSDATLQEETRLLYTDGGVLEDDMPPACKFVTVVGDVAIYGHVKDGAVTRGNRVIPSKPGALYSAPEGNFLDFEDDVTGQGSVGIYPVVFLKNKAYRIEGGIDSRGRGSAVKRSISTKVGCISHKSIVSTVKGAFFAAEDGFYYTDGFNVKKISFDLNETYKDLIDKENICGTYDKNKNWIIYSVKTDEDQDDNNKLIIFHVDFVTDSGGHPATTWSGGLVPENFSSTAVAFIDGVFYRADYSGYVFYHDDELLTDPYVDTAEDTEDWNEQVIIYDYVSVAYDFGDDQVRKWVSKIVMNAQNETDINIQVLSSNDNSGAFAELSPIRSNNSHFLWGEPTVIWGTATLLWNSYPVINQWRWMPAVRQPLRCSYKQIRMTNATTEIDTSSGDQRPCSINAATKEITLLSHPTNEWIEDTFSYFISFEYDDYAKEYEISVRTAEVLTVLDANDELIDQASTGWKIVGYKRGEKLHLLNYVLNYRMLSMTQETVRATS